MKFRPILDWILIKPKVEPCDEEGFRRSEGGIILMPAAKPDNPLMTVDVEKDVVDTEAVIVALGPGKFDNKGRWQDMWGLQPGDVITHSPNGITYFEDDGVHYAVLRRDSIVGKVTGDSPV
jgi:co-chaperonin GroES (HSP10)